MSNTTDFIIENEELVQYMGLGGTIEIPPEVKYIKIGPSTPPREKLPVSSFPKP